MQALRVQVDAGIQSRARTLRESEMPQPVLADGEKEKIMNEQKLEMWKNLLTEIAARFALGFIIGVFLGVIYILIVR